MTSTDLYPIDTADPEVLRRQAQRLKDDLTRMGNDISSLAGLLGHLAETDDETVDAIREYCAGDDDALRAVQQYTDISLTTQYEVRVTFPVTVTVVFDDVSEDDAREHVGEYLSNEMQVHVHGVEEWDYDTYDLTTDYVSRA